MLSLSDICEEEEEEEEEDDDDDVKERDAILCIPDTGKGGSDELTRLLNGHRDMSFYAGDTCDSINLTPSSYHSSNPKRCSGGSGSSNTDNGSSGCHRHALGELYANGTTAPRNKTKINVNNSHTKHSGISVIDGSSVYRPECMDTSRKYKDKRKPDLHRPSSAPSSSLISEDARNNLFSLMFVKRVGNSPSCSSSSSSSPSSPLPTPPPPPCEDHDTDSVIPTLDPGHNTNSNHVDFDDRVRNTTNMAHSEKDRAVNVEISKDKATSICVLVNGKVQASCPQHLQRHKLGLGVDTMAEAKVSTARTGLHIDGINSNTRPSADVDVSSSSATTPSDNLSQSSSCLSSTNQNVRGDDVILPNRSNKYQTMIPIYEVKRSLTRKQIIQLSAMTGVGFICVAFIILWLMSPVLF